MPTWAFLMIFAGGDQGDRLEELVEGAEAAGEDHEGLAVFYENCLADE